MIDLDAFILAPGEILKAIAMNEKACRKRAGYTQQELAERSGVNLASLRRFEQKGEISLHSLVLIATILDEQKGLLDLFPKPRYASMKELLDDQHRRD